MNYVKQLLAATALAAVSMHASAFTECTGTVTNLFSSSSDGSIIVYLSVGTAFTVATTNANFANIRTGVLAAKMSGTTVTVRYTANGVSCTSLGPVSALDGFWS